MRVPRSTRFELRRRLVTLLCAALVVVLSRGVGRACVGDGCMTIWSTEEGGGALTISWDFVHRQQIQTFKSFCAAGQCLYSTIDPGFMTPGGTPPDGDHSLADGTVVSIEIVAIDAAVTLKVNSTKLTQPGESAELTPPAPDLHTHPAWQLFLPQGQTGTYPLSFKLTTDSARYAESPVYAVVLANLPTPTPAAPTPTLTPSMTSTPARPACAGDCNDDGAVTINELVLGVASALDGTDRCPACDRDGDGMVTIGELVSAVNAALDGCPATPTATATPGATLDDIQRTIFTGRCALPTCHVAQSPAGNLILEAGQSYAQLVGVPPDVSTARDAGLLRVDPGHAENSFLLIKLEGPPPDEGSRMPLTGGTLTEAEIQRVRDWIAQGAHP